MARTDNRIGLPHGARLAGRRRPAALLSALLTVLLLLAACGDANEADPAADADSGEAAPEGEADDDADGDADGDADDNGDDNGEADTPFFEGKTVEWIVPFGEGGGTDTGARFLATWFQEAVPGNPDIVIRNVPGHSGVVGTNQFLATMPRDGTVMLHSSGSQLLAQLTDDPEVAYDFNTDFSLIYGNPAGGIAFISPDTGYTGEDLAQLADIQHDIVAAGVSAAGADGTFYYVLHRLLGLEIDVVMGYDGSGDVRRSFEGRETNLARQGTSAYLQHVVPLIEEGEALPLMSMGQMVDGELVRDPAVPDLPHPGEFYEAIHGEAPSGTEWETVKALNAVAYGMQKGLWMHADAPQEAIDAFRDAAEALANNPEFLEAAEDALGGYPLLAGAERDAALEQMMSFSDEHKAELMDYLEARFDIVR